MEGDQERLILRTDRPDVRLGTVSKGKRFDIVIRIGPDRWLREIFLPDVESMNDHPGVKRQQP